MEREFRISAGSIAPMPAHGMMLPEEFLSVLSYALDLAQRDGWRLRSGHRGAWLELWGFGAAGRRDDVPGCRRGSMLRAETMGWRALYRSDRAQQVLQPGGVQLDLSSIAKGFAVDLVSETLSNRGVTDHLVEIGGELRGSGVKPDGSPWWVALEGGDGEAERHHRRLTWIVDCDLR